MIDLKILSHVVANHLCTECGACAGICPPVALEMKETPGGQLLPSLIPSRCTECGLCDMICPELEMAGSFVKALDPSMIGPVAEAYLCEATDELVATEGQAGGLGRALLAWALESNRVQGVVTVIDDPRRPLRPKAIITTEPDQVLAASRSKYCPVAVNSLLMEMMRFKGLLAYVGVGCHMQGLALAMERLQKLREKVVLRLGLICDRILTYHAADFHLRCAGVGNEDTVTAFDYRHKEWRGWPGDIRVVTKERGARYAARQHRSGSRWLFTSAHCRLCPDKLNVLSDIALGDPHGIARGRQVPTAAVVRSARGREFLRAAQVAGKISLTPADAEEIARGQHMHEHVFAARACGREMLRRGLPLPVFLRSGPLEVRREGPRPLTVRLAIWWGITLQTPRGVWVQRHMPTWVPVVWIWLRVRLWNRVAMVFRAVGRLLSTGGLRRYRPVTEDLDRASEGPSAR